MCVETQCVNNIRSHAPTFNRLDRFKILNLADLTASNPVANLHVESIISEGLLEWGQFSDNLNLHCKMTILSSKTASFREYLRYFCTRAQHNSTLTCT